MAQWNKINQERDNGESTIMTAPFIISASRSTDIPAFYCDWFFHRLRTGYCKWINPFNGADQFISFKNVQFIVFWTKNPAPLLPYLKILDDLGIGWYIQYTLNDYEAENLEKGVPCLSQRIDTFSKLTSCYGPDRVIWRFDPLILTDTIDEDVLSEKIQRIGDQLHPHTKKLVFSFADITNYAKVKRNLTLNSIHYVDWDTYRMKRFCERLVALNRNWGLSLATCSEKIDLEKLGILHNRCVDDELIIKLAHDNPTLMKFLGVTFHIAPEPDLFGNRPQLPEQAILLDNGKYALRGNNTDSGQRALCGCINSKDIGQYNTCTHLCEYCYANTSKEMAKLNYEKHRLNPFEESIF